MTDPSEQAASVPGTSHPAPLPSALAGPLMPVRPWRPLVTGTAVAAALASAGSALAGRPLGVALVGGVGVLALVLGWAPLLNLPSPRGTTAVLATAAATVGVTGWLARPVRSGIGDLDTVLAALAVAITATFIHQLARRDGRPRLVESLVSTVAGVLLIASWAVSLPALTRPGALGIVVVVAAGVVGAAFADIVRGRWVDDIPAVMTAALLAAVGAGACGGLVDAAALNRPILILGGVIAGLGSYSLRQIFFVQPTQSRRRPQLASGAGSWLLVGVVVNALVALAS
ncbi:hypothetical protein [Austwickia sp. TVS 96-490-7B]|uniref:hypothetical protein n=1 Tax=Austwickia sp. TVS 96-490-7B TaxID=2830843 RepID=UPI001C56D5E6|nr:hypothetical protein [Austwickia sp. TVS 96-490-7B]